MLKRLPTASLSRRDRPFYDRSLLASKQARNLAGANGRDRRVTRPDFGSHTTDGIPDFSSLSLHSAQDRDSIRRGLEQAMALHESRLTRVRVTLEPLNEQRRVLRFKVEALLSRGSERQQVQFDAELQLHSQTYAVV